VNSGGGGGGGGGGYANPRYDQSGGAFPPASQFPPAQQGAQYGQAQQPTDMFAGMPPGAAPMVPQGFAQRSTAQEAGYVQGAQYRQQEPVSTTSLASRTLYQTSGPGYPPATDYASYPQAGAATASGYAAQPIDSFYGRGASFSTATSASIPAPSDYLASPAGPQPPAGYSAVPEQQQQQQQQYAETQAPPSRAPVSSPGVQAQVLSSSSGAPSSRRDRDQDRHRERERDRERDRDRDGDRHAAERHAHRHRTRP